MSYFMPDLFTDAQISEHAPHAQTSEHVSYFMPKNNCLRMHSEQKPYAQGSVHMPYFMPTSVHKRTCAFFSPGSSVY